MKNQKVQLSDAQLNQVTGGGLKKFWGDLKNWFKKIVNDPTTLIPEQQPKPSPFDPITGPIFKK